MTGGAHEEDDVDEGAGLGVNDGQGTIGDP